MSVRQKRFSYKPEFPFIYYTTEKGIVMSKLTHLMKIIVLLYCFRFFYYYTFILHMLINSDERTKNIFVRLFIYVQIISPHFLFCQITQ